MLRNRIKNHLHVDELIRERTANLVRLQSGLVFALADLVENRDRNTGGHIDRTTSYIRILLDAMVERGVYADEVSSWNLDQVASSSRLHDIGKIAIPDAILNKPGKLTLEEFETMKTHAAEGERIIGQIVSRTGEEEFLRYTKLSAGYHHERWDGSGYPYRKRGTDIPLLGRIVAIVDVYDALISERPYKRPFTEEEAIRIITNGAGSHFDPYIADVFFKVKDQIVTARTKLTQ